MQLYPYVHVQPLRSARCATSRDPHQPGLTWFIHTRTMRVQNKQQGNRLRTKNEAYVYCLEISLAFPPQLTKQTG